MLMIEFFWPLSDLCSVRLITCIKIVSIKVLGILIHKHQKNVHMYIISFLFCQDYQEQKSLQNYLASFVFYTYLVSSAMIKFMFLKCDDIFGQSAMIFQEAVRW